MRLPSSVQEIADVIGRDRALFLVGQLPRCYKTRQHTKQAGWHVILYVPKVIKPDHQLVQILGWADATKLVAVFGGEILQPANCTEVYRAFRDKTALAMIEAGKTPVEVAELLGVSDRQVRNLRREKAQEALSAANDNTPAKSANRAAAMSLSK